MSGEITEKCSADNATYCRIMAEALKEGAVRFRGGSWVDEGAKVAYGFEHWGWCRKINFCPYCGEQMADKIGEDIHDVDAHIKAYNIKTIGLV